MPLGFRFGDTPVERTGAARNRLHGFNMAPKPLDKAQEARVCAAVEDVKRGTPLKTAAKEHGVPRNTVRNRLNGVTAARGPPTTLTIEEEQLLVDWILDCSRKGFPRRRMDVLLSVKDFLDKAPERKHPFVNNLPGNKWYRMFLRRHPMIAQRTAEGITRAAGNVSEQDIRKWFEEIRTVLAEEGALDALEDPDRVGNGDESNFRLCPNKSLVLAERGAKDVYEVCAASDDKFAVTAMFAYTASGKQVEPMIIFPYKRIPAQLVQSIPPALGIGRSDSGWMTAETFYEWISNILAPFIVNKQIKTPFILFVDGHKTHLTRETSALCKELGIVLIALYPNATHILQPCDVAAFRPLKAAWSNALLVWRRDHPHESLTKECIGPILQAALQKDMTQAIVNGFRVTGLHPFNPDAVNYKKCKGHVNKPTENEAEQEQANPPVSLTMVNFQDLVGEEIFRSLQTYTQASQENSAMAALHRVFTALKGNPSEAQAKATTEEVGADTVAAATPQARMSPVQAAVAGPSQTPASPVRVAVVNPSQAPIRPTEVDLSLVRAESPSSDDDPDDPDMVEPRPASSASNTSLRDVLVWPHSPQRKGKRQVERMPYVTTSERWRDMQDEKDRKKREAEAEKEARKEARLAKKARQDAEKAAKAAAAATKRAGAAPARRSSRNKK
ncbi:Pogo transposable element with KRAB domain [Frankliniella fusca]|uniref:Pogo transposable element with KRAB domain n=1 Tax=Frankliniella fusca TaxID=407009 RepID=A0AAE1HK98_9NEOP|nr:Pogo transposable element with KRAB domain [Frankliniella fusca]